MLFIANYLKFKSIKISVRNIIETSKRSSSVPSIRLEIPLNLNAFIIISSFTIELSDPISSTQII